MDVINKYCPRSGKKIVPDSLTDYSGYTVGFCNPNCRDDFANNPQLYLKECLYFDVLIKEKE